MEGSPALDAGDDEFNRGESRRSTLSNKVLQRTS